MSAPYCWLVMPELAFTPTLFAIFSSLIEERMGMSYTPRDQALLAEKISSRALEVGFDSLLDYYYFLRYDENNESELQALVNSLVVNETFFFRELPPLQHLVTHFLAPMCKAGKKPRVWCAACSTGEEPLTLAMLLAEQGLLGQVELIATDISSAVLERARSGQHSRRSVRQLPAPELAARWLTLHERGVSVDPTLGAHVQWKLLNLLDQDAIASLGTLDLILCRNVLIYFKDAIVSRVVNDLSRQLRLGGVLLIGISESLVRFGSALSCEEAEGVFLYRKVVT